MLQTNSVQCRQKLSVSCSAMICFQAPTASSSYTCPRISLSSDALETGPWQPLSVELVCQAASPLFETGISPDDHAVQTSIGEFAP